MGILESERAAMEYSRMEAAGSVKIVFALTLLYDHDDDDAIYCNFHDL